MSNSTRSKSSLTSDCTSSMYIPGKKWEFPVPRCEDYWEKLFDTEADRLIIVRNPSRDLSHRIFSKRNPNLVNFNLPSDENVSDRNSSSNSFDNDRKALKNSLHKLTRAKSKSNAKSDSFEDAKPLSTPILKSSSRPGSKIPVTTSDLTAPSRTVRIPKLDPRSPQPSSGEMPAGKVDRIRAPFNVENEPKLRGKGSPTLPPLAALAKPPNPELTLKKLRKCSRLPEKKDREIGDQPRNKVAGVKNKKPSRKLDQTVEKDQTVLTDEESLKYSARFAYKALKRVLKNSRLDFEPKAIVYSQEDSQLASSNDSSRSANENRDSPELKDTGERKPEEDPPFVRDPSKVSERKVKDFEFSRTADELGTLKPENATPRTIPTGSRSTSGPSPQFAYPQNWESPSSRVLASIPKLSGYPRKNRDKCLPCMYKTFEPPRKRVASLPRTLFQRIVHSESKLISSSRDSTEDSDESSSSFSSLSIASLENELEKSWYYEPETPDLRLDEERNAAESRVVTEPAPVPQEKREHLAETVRQKNIPDTDPALKAITRKGKEDQRDDDSTLKNLSDVEASCARDPSLEGTKEASSSLRSESSDEGDENAVSMADDQPRPKFLVPCHIPTNLAPSLEPLRALRNRKATTLQDRIAMLETPTVKKKTSTGSFDEIPEKSSSEAKQTAGKEKSSGGEEKPAPPPLTKAKSMLENLTMEEAKKRKHVLRKGVTVSSLPLTKDGIPDDDGEKYSDASTEPKATPPEDTLETFLERNFSRPGSKLPLSSAKEIVEILNTLDENASTTDILDSLCKEFCKRLADADARDDPETRERKKLIGSLTKLLTDSKRYSCTDNSLPNSRLSPSQSPACNPRFLRRMLPIKTFNAVAPLLRMPEWLPERRASFQSKLKIFDYSRPSDAMEESFIFDSLEVQPPTLREDPESLDNDEEKVGHPRYNPYGLFLTKPRREVVTWRALTKRDLEGYDPDATLEMRAENMMKNICKDFCGWVEGLGGTDKIIDEEVLRDMFEIDFSAEACRAMQVLIREMPVVPAEVAFTRNAPGAGKLSRTKKHVMTDVKAEQRPRRTIAFGQTLPPEIRFVPPKNDVHRKWLECEYVPVDLETMDMVWKDITHLKSVRGFVEWLQEHPEVRPPAALKKIVSMDVGALRQTEDDETFAHLELDIDQIQSLRVAVNNTAA